MSTTAALESYTADDLDQPLQYRAIHTGAIVGLILGVLSVFMLFTAANSLESCLMVVPIPLLGIFVSLRSWAKIRREPDQYTGGPAAFTGLLLSLVFLFGGLGYGGYVYATEVPDGYTRISFAELKPSELDERAGHFIPPEVAALAGQRVFIKGYIRPDSTPVRTGISQFLLVRDDNQCCFGDASKVQYYDQIAVDLTGSLRLDYSMGVFRIGGILAVEPANLRRGPGAPVFSLRADYAK